MVALVAGQRCKMGRGIGGGDRMTIGFGVRDDAIEHVGGRLQRGEDGAAILLLGLIERRLGGRLPKAPLAGVEHRLRDRSVTNQKMLPGASSVPSEVEAPPS